MEQNSDWPKGQSHEKVSKLRACGDWKNLSLITIKKTAMIALHH